METPCGTRPNTLKTEKQGAAFVTVDPNVDTWKSSLTFVCAVILNSKSPLKYVRNRRRLEIK